MKTEIESIHDKFFKLICEDPVRARILLSEILPVEIKERLDFSKLEIDLTEYVSGKFKGTRKDVVVRTLMATWEEGKNGKKTFIDADIYFLFEHKSGWVSGEELFLKLFSYKQVMWEKDMAAKPSCFIMAKVSGTPNGTLSIALKWMRRSRSIY
ncbi:MAG: Rpn family recombination-promoting nuclease/putative transposase [bacterium]|nr:Rpn family recombination-promoting nuclease/putative transposase [bacterium]